MTNEIIYIFSTSYGTQQVLINDGYFLFYLNAGPMRAGTFFQCASRTQGSARKCLWNE